MTDTGHKWFKYVLIPDIHIWEQLGWVDVARIGHYSHLLKWNRESPPIYPDLSHATNLTDTAR